MSSVKKLDEVGHKIYDFLINPKVVKISIFAAIIIFFTCIGVGYFIAQFDLAGPGGDKAGFNWIENFISDLGNRDFTPITNFLDDGAMFTALFMIPLAFYTEKMLGESVDGEKSLMRRRLTSYGLITFLFGIIGLWGIGFFNEEVGRAFGTIVVGLNFHDIFSAVVFLGLGGAGCVFGIVIVFYPTKFPKIIGIYMMFIPFTTAVIYLTTIIKWLEWVLLFSLFAYLIPCGLVIIRHINREQSWKEPKEKMKRTFKEMLIETKRKIHGFLTNPKVIKYCVILFYIIFIPSLIVGYIVANVFDVGDVGYNMLDNMISDLGSFNYTKIPKFLDDAAMISAVLLVPVIFYLKKTFCTYSQIKEEKLPNKILKLTLTNLALLTGLASMIGLFGIGFFSEDTSKMLKTIKIFGFSTHMFFSLLVFSSLIFTGFLIGLYMLFYPKTTAKRSGLKIPWIFFLIFCLEMIIWPPIHGVGYLLDLPPSQAFHEWFMLITVLIWAVPLFYVLLRKARKELSTR